MKEKNKYKILSGIEASKHYSELLKNLFISLNEPTIFKIIQVGDLAASNKYINNKIKKAKELGIEAILVKLDASISQEDLKTIVQNEALSCDGIIVQLPLPEHINSQEILNIVPIEKDIDGLSELNQFNFYNFKEESAFSPATARGIIMLLDYYNIPIANKKTFVIGESNLVGKPTKFLLNKKGGIVKSFNKNTGIFGSNEADVLVVAAGEANLVKTKDVKENATIIDVGINSLTNNKITGDVDFESVKHKVSAISPVPGGVGPMTVIALFYNLYDAKIRTKKTIS
ncbi:bifunctional 5,10-methylenetetrahydrofolate dehydrogenase/5,10-methenyltetrahydrofolate cyclohydrolase [Mesomycoplasma molare]|uniref:Bifunctional protein FolD n=1 Tax=Mesomycoplasma molare TaxID=171288 RepID=A0ABY5TUJ4_9BACT|nr:bifunctional 5,10-methylenetetrahydrofolate dehydrogenase/5,10-methenyltetrahydrofolate cyclohydrolase [Mesomycoplasma molare]UWD34260.1 bifunctional 5,10-methylenetetrahydrofolate dehydrogenase/5,10-methenyltetrahydrofolate cyclohydrolase [Mesomycoplasma molare]